MKIIELNAQEIHNIYANTGKRVPGEGIKSYGTGSFSDSRTGFTLMVRVTTYGQANLAKGSIKVLKEEFVDPRTGGFKVDQDKL